MSEDRSAAGDQDPSNTYWQRDLAAAHSRVGDVLQSQGKLAETQTEFGEYLKISRRLADQDPSNAYWQRDLAAIYVEMGRLASQMGMNTTALPLYEEASRIFGTLVMSSPGFTEWAEEKETVDSELRLCRTKDIS